MSDTAINVAQSTVGTHAEELIQHLLSQIIAILACTKLVVFLTRKFRQTDVSGEILAGLLLGPSCLGFFAPNVMGALFHPSTSQIFVGIAQIGLVLLMFQIGLEFEFKTNLESSKKSIALVSAMGMVVPFVFGYLSATWFYNYLPEPRPDLLGFRLFFAIAMSITAIPILGRIFMELNLSHTRTAALTIGAAAIDDVVGWILLGIVTLVAKDQFSLGWLGLRVTALVLYLGCAVFLLRPLLKRLIGRPLAETKVLTGTQVALVLLIVFASGSMTSAIGVFAIIGGFIVGILMHDDRAFVEQWKLRVSPLVNTFFLPIFFAYTGLRTQIGSLNSLHEWFICGLVILVAFVSKFGGAYVGAIVAGETPRSAAAIGVCMNTRALMELVAINIGYDIGVLPRSMFTMLVIMAIASTFVATPLIRWLLQRERTVPSNVLVKVTAVAQTAL